MQIAHVTAVGVDERHAGRVPAALGRVGRDDRRDQPAAPVELPHVDAVKHHRGGLSGGRVDPVEPAPELGRPLHPGVVGVAGLDACGRVRPGPVRSRVGRERHHRAAVTSEAQLLHRSRHVAHPARLADAAVEQVDRALAGLIAVGEERQRAPVRRPQRGGVGTRAARRLARPRAVGCRDPDAAAGGRARQRVVGLDGAGDHRAVGRERGPRRMHHVEQRLPVHGRHSGTAFLLVGPPTRRYPKRRTHMPRRHVPITCGSSASYWRWGAA